jgi:hypothetical protein
MNLEVCGLSKHRQYKRWKTMIDRCEVKTFSAYKYYGERGIKVCDRWHNLANFIEDMDSTYKEGLSIDRIDVNSDYSPDNCKWSTVKEQCSNKRSSILHTYKGVIKCFAGWVEYLETTYSKLYLRKSKYGMDKAIEMLLNNPSSDYRCISGEEHHSAHLNNLDVENIIQDLLNRVLYKTISSKYGISEDLINRINRGKCWKHILPNISRPIRAKQPYRLK